MIKKAFAIYDNKAECYTDPFFMRTDGQALRAVMDDIKEGRSHVGKNPEDYTLWELGSYDDSNAAWVGLAPPRCLAKCHELKQTNN